MENEEFGTLEPITKPYYQNNICNLTSEEATNLFFSKRNVLKIIKKLDKYNTINHIIPRPEDYFVMLSDYTKFTIHDIHQFLGQRKYSGRYFEANIFFIKKIQDDTYLGLRKRTDYDSDTPRDYLYLVDEGTVAKLALEDKLTTEYDVSSFIAEQEAKLASIAAEDE